MRITFLRGKFFLMSEKFFQLQRWGALLIETFSALFMWVKRTQPGSEFVTVSYVPIFVFGTAAPWQAEHSFGVGL